MIISGLISIRLITAIAKDMVNWELAKRVIPNLYYAGERIVLDTKERIQHLQTDESGQNSNTPPASTEYLVHNKLEALFAWFQCIVLWHNPFDTITFIVAVTVQFL